MRIVRSDDKKRLNVISHFLGLIPYEAPPAEKIELPNRDEKWFMTTRRR